MITIQNERICVTVSESAFNTVLETKNDIEHLRRRSENYTETAYQQTRSHFLSRAMEVIGNTSELGIIKNESTDDIGVSELAKKIAIFRYLEKNGKYKTDETMLRGLGGHRMSLGMASEWNCAINTEIQQSDIDQARENIGLFRQAEIRYRQAKSNGSGMVIEVIGDLPEQIGFCRVQRNLLIANDCIF